MSRPRIALAIVFALLCSMFSTACGFVGRNAGEPERPADIEGTWETASALTLGICGVVDDAQGGVRLVLNSDGVCVFSATSVETCPRYSNAEVTINGLALERVFDGGWTSEPMFAPETNGHGHGCTYPKFHVPCSPSSNRYDVFCYSKDLYSESGNLDVTVRIGDEARTFTIGGFTKRNIRVTSGPMVPGKVATVEAGPRAFGNPSLAFDYDDVKKNTAWCAIQHNATPYGQTRPYDETGDCSKGTGCCTSWGIAEVDPTAWNGDRFEFLVPARLPSGEGFLELGESVEAPVSLCPFADCRVAVGRTSRVRVEIVAP